jgi:Lon protease-like protein
MESWEENMFTLQEPKQILQERLTQIIDSYPELKTLYPGAPTDNYSWVVYRWLELLPIKAAEKQQLIGQQNPDPVVNFLEGLIK